MKKFEVLFNKSYGGFSLSKEATEELNKTYGWNKTEYDFNSRHPRHDPRLIMLFKEKGSKWFSGVCADIDVVEVEADGYTINDYDGMESVEEKYADFVLV